MKTFRSMCASISPVVILIPFFFFLFVISSIRYFFEKNGQVNIYIYLISISLFFSFSLSLLLLLFRWLVICLIVCLFFWNKLLNKSDEDLCFWLIVYLVIYYDEKELFAYPFFRCHQKSMILMKI